LHEGVFSLIFGDGRTVGQALVTHPAIKAVGFTGSRGGGMALVRAAAARPEPIPVYAEMSSINPVFVLDDALARLQKEIASGYVDSLTLGAGQFCTNPGLVFAGEGDALNAFCTTAAAALEAKAASTMLSPAIHAAFTEGVQKLAAAPGVELVARGQEASGPHGGQAALFRTDAATFLGNPALEEENFGASSLVIAYRDFGEIKQIAEALEGQLTATVFMTDRDRAAAAALLPILERKVGRILINGYPTGVEVSHAMVHGGPFPATSDSRTTSVGATAIDRFLRPVCYQDVPSYLLPPALQDGNPLGIWRVKDGELSQA
jgi:NADP-dependent aldehyde dehydrogenase